MPHREAPVTIPLRGGLRLTGTVDVTAAGRQLMVTVDGDPLRSNRLLERLHEVTRDEPNCWDGFAPEVDLLIGDDPDTVVLYLVASRQSWVAEHLGALIEEDPIERVLTLWRSGDAISAVAIYCEDQGVSVAAALRELVALGRRS